MATAQTRNFRPKSTCMFKHIQDITDFLRYAQMRISSLCLAKNITEINYLTISTCINNFFVIIFFPEINIILVAYYFQTITNREFGVYHL